MSYVLPFCMALLYLSSLSTSTKKTDVKRDYCNKTVDIYESVSSPGVTSDNVGRPMTCWYRFRSFRGTPKDWVIRLRFKKFKVGTLVNASYCHNGYIEIIDGNAKTDFSNRKEPGLFCGEIEQPQTFISETSSVNIFFHVDNFTDQTYFSLDSREEQEFDVYLRYGQHPELYPNRRGQIVTGSYCERIFQDCRLQTCYIQSPAYPGIYPRHLHCSYHLNTHLPFIKLYIENEEFNIDGQRCENIMTCPMRPISSGSHNCPYDYIRIYDGKNSSSPEIGTFCGMGKFPYSIIGTGSDLFVQFFSSAAGPLLNTGFHFNVGNWPGNVETAGSRNGICNWLLTSQDLEASGNCEGIFLSIPHWYPPHTSCSYLIQGKPGQIVRLYFPSFRINRIESPIAMFEGDCGESLTLYDSSWSDDSNIIKTFCDTFSRVKEKHDFVSTGNNLLVKFESKTGSYSGSSLYYWAHYDFFNNTKFGRAVPETFCDEVFTSWDSTDGYLRSPLNTLVYKRAEMVNSLRCIYKFITDRRVFARIILTVTAVNFKDTMPCNECWEERIDKLIIFEPSMLPNASTRNHCLCNNLNLKSSKPVIITSKSETLNLELIIDSAHLSKYFKDPNPLFEATYKFIHSPVCGSAFLPAVPEGEIYFPRETPEPSGFVHCLWEIQINRDRDVWIHFDTIRFATRDCKDGRIDMFLTSKLEQLTICGHNMSAIDIPILTSKDFFLDALPFVKIQYIGTISNVAFKIVWTELLHLPHNIDGSSITSRLTDNSFADSSKNCEFLCPGEPTLCIPASLVCNGIVNCPISNVNDSIIPGGDESVELCMIKTDTNNFNWIVIGLSSSCLVLVIIFCCCRGCIKLDSSDDEY